MSGKAGAFVLGAILLGVGSVFYTGFFPDASYSWTGTLFMGVGIFFIAVSVLAKRTKTTRRVLLTI